MSVLLTHLFKTIFAICLRLAGLAPQLSEGLTNVRVKAPEKVELICRINPGFPIAEIEWYRSGKCCKIFKEIFSDEKYDIKITEDEEDFDCVMVSLIIAVSEVSDSAIYRCEAVNKFGKVRTECRVVVLGTFRSFISI